MAVARGRGEESASWNVMENAKDQYIRGMWEYFSCERLKAKNFREMPRKQNWKGYKAKGNAYRLPKNVENK